MAPPRPLPRVVTEHGSSRGPCLTPGAPMADTGVTAGTSIPEGTLPPPWRALPRRTVPSQRPRPSALPSIVPSGRPRPLAMPPQSLSRPLPKPRPPRAAPAGSGRGAEPRSVARRAGEGSGAASPSRLWQRQRRVRRGRGCSSESNGAVRAGQRAEGRRQGARHRALRQGTAEGGVRGGEVGRGSLVPSERRARARRDRWALPPLPSLLPSAFPPGGLRVPSRLPRASRCGSHGPRSPPGTAGPAPLSTPEHPGGCARGGSRRGAGTKAEPRACARRREGVREPR